jgi:hypothetical protein
MNFLECTIFNPVINLHRVVIHLSAAVRANQLRFIHRVHDSDSRAVPENIFANSQAMLQSRSHVASNRRFPYRC